MTGPTEPLSVVAARGDRRATLVALRGTLALRLEMCEPKDAAALARQMQAVLREIDEIPTQAEESPADEVKRKRDERRGRTRAAHPAGAGR